MNIEYKPRLRSLRRVVFQPSLDRTEEASACIRQLMTWPVKKTITLNVAERTMGIECVNKTLPATQFHENNDHLFYAFLAGAGILSHPCQFESISYIRYPQ